MKQFNKHIFLSLVCVFLFNALLPFFTVYDDAETVAPQKITTLFGEKILICTGDGFKWVSARDLQSGKETQHPHAHYKCALCFLAAHGLKDLALLGAILLAYALMIRGVMRIHYRPRTLHSFWRSFHQSRAPPTLSLR